MSTDWDARRIKLTDLDEMVHLAMHDPHWIEQATLECERIARDLGAGLVAAEHIGSTAVKDLLAKPVIDLMLGVFAYPPSQATTELLQSLGYTAMGEAGVPGRSYFRLRGPRNFNVHVVEYGGAHWKTNLALRNYLARSSQARERYANAKAKALTDGAVTLLPYSEAKAAVLEVLVREALRGFGG